MGRKNLYKYFYNSPRTHERVVGVVTAFDAGDATQKVMASIIGDLKAQYSHLTPEASNFLLEDNLKKLNFSIAPVEFKNDMAEICTTSCIGNF